MDLKTCKIEYSVSLIQFSGFFELFKAGFNLMDQ